MDDEEDKEACLHPRAYVTAYKPQPHVGGLFSCIFKVKLDRVERAPIHVRVQNTCTLF